MSREWMHSWKAVAASVLPAFILLAVISAAGCGGQVGTGPRSSIGAPPGEDYSDLTVIITKAKYDQVTDGMSYDQVVGVLGGEGIPKTKVMANSGVVTSMYQWRGNGGPASFAQFSFADGRLVKKVESGLR